MDPLDLDAWLDTAEGVVLLASSEDTIAGRPARVVDVTVDPTIEGEERDPSDKCSFEGLPPCLTYGVGAPPFPDRSLWIAAGRVTRLHVLTIEGFEPLVVEVGAAAGSDWFDQVAETILPSLVLGPDGPPPAG